MRCLFFVFVVVCTLCVFTFPAFSQAKHPFTFEDMMKLKRIGEPVPSPDGKWVLFAAVDVDLASNKKTSHIWIVPLGTTNASPHGATGPSPVQHGAGPGNERALIPSQDGDRPRWAPDGKHFAFLSTKEGGSQIWIADFDDAAGAVTAVHKLTSIATEAGGELWSPDGKNILFTSDVYPECDDAATREAEFNAESFCNARKVKEAEELKVKALIFDRLLYRHWNAYKRGMRTHLFVTPIDGGAVRDLTPGDYDSPEFSLGGQDNYAFSPDGQEICYTSNHDKVEATSTNNDLWIVPVNTRAGGAPVAPKNITADNPASDSTPLYSPDGKYIAYRAQERPGYESDRFRLMLYDRTTGEKKNLTEKFDRWVATFTWAPDSRSVFFTAENRGRSPIYRFTVEKPAEQRAGDWPEDLLDGFNDDLAIVPGRKTIVFTRMSIGGPNEIYMADPPGPNDVCALDKLTTSDPRDWYQDTLCVSEPVALGRLNEEVLSRISTSQLEPFWFPGAKGEKVEGFLVRPPNFDAGRKYPVKILIHGGPEGAWGDDWSYRWNPELFAANGYVVIMINFHGSTGYGQKFIDAINGDWGGAPFEDLMKGLDYAEKTYPFIDKDRECALGASYGGYMANWVLGHTDRFKCVVSHDGMFNTVSAWGTTEELWFNNWEFKGTPYTNPEMYEKWNPRNAAKNFKTPTLVVHGQLDYRLDVSEGFQLFTTLQTMGVPSKMLYFPDEGHWVLKPQNSQLWYKTVTDWVDQWTKK
jgi:dipeptidyl aminopeptidase/acylaminoacyl peptidase